MVETHDDFRQLSPSLVEAAAVAAKRYGVSGALHPKDYIFWYVHDNEPAVLDKAQAPEFYFQSGYHTVTFLRDLLNEPRVKALLADRPHGCGRVSILEFASGYGRVTRHFPAILPEASVVACDIHEEAVTFIRSMGLEARLSSSVPEQFELGRTFDIIFALSFFTHMPRSTWSRWLRMLAKHLTSGGLLIFTTHGEVSQGLMGVSKLEPDGFHFTGGSEQTDLSVADYGNTVTVFDYVYSQFKGSDLKLIQYKQAGIAHHDVYVLYRRRDLTADRSADEIKAVRARHSWKMTELLKRLSTAIR